MGEEGGINIYIWVGNNAPTRFDYLGLEYDKNRRLDRLEASQLACALGGYVTQATFASWAFYGLLAHHFDPMLDFIYTAKFLRRYLEGIGGEVELPYSALRGNAKIQLLNQQARDQYKAGKIGNINTRVQFLGEDGDLHGAVHIAAIEYKLNKGLGQIEASLKDIYTFHDNPADPNDPGTFSTQMPAAWVFDQWAECCEWKGGSNISELWLRDLEVHGLAKPFDVKAEWTFSLDPEVLPPPEFHFYL